MNNTHIMLDLETMGNGPNASILSAGLVAFNNTNESEPDILGTLELAIDLESSVKYGGVIDPSTVIWWMQPEQGPARINYLSRKEFYPITVALNAIGQFIKSYSSVKPLPLIWGNGVTFDNTILRSAFQNTGMEVPWNFRQDMCFRTLKGLRPYFTTLQPKFEGVQHSALADAKHQARWLNRILQKF